MSDLLPPPVADASVLLSPLHALLETMGRAVLLGHAGEVHRTEALRRFLAHSPDRDLLEFTMQQLARRVLDRGGAGAPVRVGAALLHARRLPGAVPLVVVVVRGAKGAGASAGRIMRTWRLTRREAEVAVGLAEGLSTAEIAGRLALRPSTIRRHTERVFRKLGVRRRAQVGPRLAGAPADALAVH